MTIAGIRDDNIDPDVTLPAVEMLTQVRLTFDASKIRDADLVELGSRDQSATMCSPMLMKLSK